MRGTWGPLGGTERKTGHGTRPRPVFPAHLPLLSNSLTKSSSTTRGRTETLWRTSSAEGTGSGCSAYDAKPSRQTGAGCSKRTIAAVYALPGTPSSSSHPAKFPYTAAGTSALNDVTSGNNGTCTTSCLCTARSGHDGPTGWGTPEGVTAFTG